jgi:hypothetical protein
MARALGRLAPHVKLTLEVRLYQSSGPGYGEEKGGIEYVFCSRRALSQP